MAMIKQNYDIQTVFLAELVKHKSPVAVYLKNGIKLKGFIKGFDEFSILLDNPSMQMIYKTAISTVMQLPALIGEHA